MTPDLLPPNATPLERAAVRVPLAAIDAIGLPHRSLWNPDTCPAALLTWLAWTVGIEGWRPEWDDDVKRSRIKTAIDIQRTKGTVYSVRRVVQSYGGNITLREWWQTTPAGTPHTFELVLTLDGQNGDQSSAQFVDDIIADINRTKPLRSHFTFAQGLSGSGAIGVVAAGRPVAYARLDCTIN